jgi:hypothetical protein
MAFANTTIQIRKSGATGNVPTSLNFGELAINYFDNKLYYKNGAGNISYFYGSNNGPSFATANANNSLITASAPNDTISFVPANGISITACTTTKTVTIGDGATYNQANTATNNAAGASLYANGAFIQANAAFITANNALPNTGSVITVNTNSVLYVSNTTNATSNTTGALIVYGGISTRSNVYANSIYTNGLYYANGTPYSTGGGGSAVVVSDVAPSSPVANSLWWKSDEGTLKIYYTDTNGSQWVDAVATVAGPVGPQGPNGTSLISNYVYDLDDISYKTDGFTGTFPLTYNYASANISSPFLITVTVNGLLQPAFDYKYDTVWQSSILSASKGYTIDNVGNPTSNGYIKFAECPSQGSQILIRTVVGNPPTSLKLYPFKPLDVFMGY